VSGKGGEKSSRFNILWQAEQHIPISAEHMNTGRIPIFFDIPHDQIPTDCEHDLNPKFWLNKSYSWSLEIYAKLEGADFKQTIKIPIYDPETTTRDIPTSTTHMARNETHVANYSYDGDWRKTGVIYTDYGDDGSFYYFPAARHKASTMFVTVVGIILSVFTIGLFLESGGRLMSCFVGVFAFVFIWATVKGWFYKSSLDVSKTHVHIRKGFLSGRIYSFDPSDILSVSPSGHMQEDVKSYFDIKVRTISGKTIKLAWGLLGKRDVESLCDKIRQDLGRDMTRDPHVVKAGNFTLLKMQNM